MARTETATPRRGRAGVTFDEVTKIALSLPHVEEGTSYGTAAFRVGSKLLARLKEDGETLVVRISFEERDALLQMNPRVFFITDHYVKWPMVLVRLATATEAELRQILADAWRETASKRLLEAHPVLGATEENDAAKHAPAKRRSTSSSRSKRANAGSQVKATSRMSVAPRRGSASKRVSKRR